MGCYVDGITTSIEQAQGATENVKSAGLSDRVTIHLMDYRDMPAEWENRFDACISTEMLEVCRIVCVVYAWHNVS